MQTTLIRCLLASLTPAEGSIRVFGEEPGSVRSEVPGHDVGYMPQEIALYEEFTILQNLDFYGKLHDMSAEEIKERSDYLCKLLDIDEVKDRNVAKLSGGQQRRVSLACSLDWLNSHTQPGAVPSVPELIEALIAIPLARDAIVLPQHRI